MKIIQITKIITIILVTTITKVMPNDPTLTTVIQIKIPLNIKSGINDILHLRKKTNLKATLHELEVELLELGLRVYQQQTA